MTYTVGVIGENHHIHSIIIHTKNKQKAFTIAEKEAKKHNLRIGVWEHTRYKFYGLIKSF